MRERLIAFQNQAEKDFHADRNLNTLFYYLLALVVFFASTFIAVCTLPFRLAAKAVLPKKPGASIKQVDRQGLDALLREEELVLIDFWAAWCGPCMMMDPVIEELATGASGICVAKVNADTNKALVDRFKIRGLPQLVLIKQGKEIGRHAGPLTGSQLRRFCFGENG